MRRTSIWLRVRLWLRVFLLLAVAFVSSGLQCSEQRELRAVRVVGGLSSPVFVTAPPRDRRLFIVERGGRIKLLSPSGGLLALPFLDISTLTAGSGERGLLGLAFPVDYAETGLFYVAYTDLAGDSTLARYAVSEASPDRADASSAEILLVVGQPRGTHNGGHLAFDPDGMLLYGIGDGGGSGDPDGNGQDPGNRLGSILRLDVRGAPGSGYAIPPDNPFRAAGDGIPDEIWAYGLRNPYRFSVDALRRLLFIGDVGQDAREELNVQRFEDSAGGNYGWSVREGTLCFGASADCDDPRLIDPVHEYEHADERCAIVDGVTHYGRIPETWGHHFFADACSADVWSAEVVVAGDGSVELQNLEQRTAELAHPSGSLDNPVGFGIGGRGALYVVDLDGELYEITRAEGGL